MNLEKLKIQNRIALLSSNGKENQNIVKKLKRRLRNIEKQEA
jgi:hypothetical protein